MIRIIPVVTVLAALYTTGCGESNEAVDARPAPVVASVSISPERAAAIADLMASLPPGTRLRRAQDIQVSNQLGEGVVATAWFEGDAERRIFAPEAPLEADIALAYLVELERAKGLRTNRVDLRAEDVARYGVFGQATPGGQEVWRAELAQIFTSGRSERVGDTEVRVALKPRLMGTPPR